MEKVEHSIIWPRDT